MRVVPQPNVAEALGTLQKASTETQESMRARVAEAVDTAWLPALASAAGTQLERRLLVEGAGAQVGLSTMTLVAGNGGPLSGGLTEDSWYAGELGMTPVEIVAPNRRKTIRISGSGREIRVQSRVWVGRNLRPRNEDGYVIFPTVRTHGPRFVAAWIYGLIDVYAGSQFDTRKG